MDQLDIVMSKCAVSEYLADLIINKNYRIQLTKQAGNVDVGVKTKKMAVVSINFKIPNAERNNFAETALNLFPTIKGESLQYDGLHRDIVTDTYEIIVFAHYPLPYKSAERVNGMKPAEFLSIMSLYKISQVIKNYLPSSQRDALTMLIKDPRCPREVWLSEQVLLIKKILKNLFAKKVKHENHFNEYF